jgi:hypothetical protein
MRDEAKRALWKRQAGMAHALRKQARGQDCEDLALDLTTLLQAIERRDGGQESPKGVEPLRVRSAPPGRGNKPPKVEARQATSGNERTERTSDETKTVKRKALAAWRTLIRRPQPPSRLQ